MGFFRVFQKQFLLYSKSLHKKYKLLPLILNAQFVFQLQLFEYQI